MSATHLNYPSPSQLIGELRQGLLGAPAPDRAEALTRIGSLLERLKAHSNAEGGRALATDPAARI